MAKNFVQPGDVLTLTSPEGGLLSGQGFVVGSIFAVATTDAKAGEPVEGAVTSVWSLPKISGAISEGDALYWTGTALTKTAAGNVFVGVAVNGGTGADDATVDCRLSGALGLAVDAGHTAELADHESRIAALESA